MISVCGARLAPEGRKVVSGHGFSRAEKVHEKLARAFRPSKGVNKLQFQIKGQDFFLAFVEQEKRWYVFSPTSQGINRIPVYVDAEKYELPGILGTETHLSS